MTYAAAGTVGTARLTELQESFESAAQTAGEVERHIVVFGLPVRLRFAGAPSADALWPAFAHLEADAPAPAVLTLHVWDSAGTGTTRPTFAPPAEPEASADGSGAGPSYFHESDGVRVLHQPASDSLSVLSLDDAAWFWVPDARALPYWDYTAPFRHILAWWLAGHGYRIVHGAAVGREAAAVLLVGRGGSGKSTTSLSTLLDDRLRLVGDDYVAAGFPDGEPTVHSLYAFGKLHWRDLDRLPGLRDAVANAGGSDEKAVIDIFRSFPERCSTSFPLRAIVVPRVTGGTVTRVADSSHREALAALAPSTIFQIYPPAPEALAELTQLVRAVPTFALELGTDVQGVSDAIVGLLEHLG